MWLDCCFQLSLMENQEKGLTVFFANIRVLVICMLLFRIVIQILLDLLKHIWTVHQLECICCPGMLWLHAKIVPIMAVAYFFCVRIIYLWMPLTVWIFTWPAPANSSLYALRVLRFCVSIVNLVILMLL